MLHLAFVLFVALGGLLVLRWPKVAFLHIPCALWGVAIEFGGWICPLTPLEQHFLRLAGEAGYEGGFLEHYIWPLIYPDELTRGMQVGLGLAVLLGVDGCSGSKFGFVGPKFYGEPESGFGSVGSARVSPLPDISVFGR